MGARRIAAVFAVLVTAIAAQAVSVGPADAATCTGTSHCYGRAYWNVSSPSGFEGGNVTLRTNCMTVSDYTSEILTNEMWVSSDASASYWTEVGITVGPHNGGGYSNSPTYFWADKRPGTGGYHDHFFAGPVPLNTYVNADIIETSNGSGSWAVSIGGNSSTSTSNFAGPSRRLVTGTESTTDSGHTYGSSTNMSYYSLTRTKVAGWNSASAGGAVLDGLLTRQWANQYNWLSDGQGATC
jgi:hypothetical protein